MTEANFNNKSQSKWVPSVCCVTTLNKANAWSYFLFRTSEFRIYLNMNPMNLRLEYKNNFAARKFGFLSLISMRTARGVYCFKEYLRGKWSETSRVAYSNPHHTQVN
jgi:hypothetical protein